MLKVLFVRSGNHGPGPITQNQGQSLIDAGCQVEYFNIVGYGIFGYLKNILDLRRAVKKINPDIIHAHYGYSGMLASVSFTGKPVVASLMGSDVNNANYLFLLIIRIFIRFIWSVTIVKTRILQKRLMCNNVEVIPNGVDLDRFKPVNMSNARSILNWSAENYNLLFPADPSRPEKNFNLCYKAVEKLRPSVTGMDLHCLVGVNPEKVFLYYNAADILILTSINEGSPNVIKEAMACNCPIVSTDVGDVREIISETEGCFITSFDPDDVCEKIKLALEFGKRTIGRDKIKHLSSELVAERLIGIYEEVMDSCR